MSVEDTSIDEIKRDVWKFQPRLIAYHTPEQGTHPAVRKAREAADRLNQCYEELLDTHQEVGRRLVRFKVSLDGSEESPLGECLEKLKQWVADCSAHHSLRVREEENEGHVPYPIEMIVDLTECSEDRHNDRKKLEGAVKELNSLLDSCHQFLEGIESNVTNLRENVDALKRVSVTMEIQEIWTRFEKEGPTNAEQFTVEIRTLLQEIGNVMK